MNTGLIDIITRYITQPKTDFAILINGEWGSGKTFYIKNQLAKAISNLKFKVSEKEEKAYDLVYVNLYGITSTEELQKKLIIELNPWMKTATYKATDFIVSKGLDFLKNFKINLSGDDKLKLVTNIFGGIPINKILVFDDLERLSTNTLNEVLGFINTYTEHQNLKVVVVADEEKIKDKIPDYQKVKEKLIRFTFLFQPIIEEAFPSFIEKYPSKEYQTFLKENANYIGSLFVKAKYKNLRSLKFVLDLFENIYSGIKSRNVLQSEYEPLIFKRLLLFLVTYSIAYKKGATVEELNSLKDLSSEVDAPSDRAWLAELFEEIKEGDEQVAAVPNAIKVFKEDFEKTFLDQSDYNFQHFPSIAYFVGSGNLMVEELVSTCIEIQAKLIAKKEKPEYITLDKLNNCLLLEDEELAAVVEDILRFVKEGHYKLEEYPNIFQSLSNLSDNNIAEIKIDEATVDLFKEGMEKSLASSVYKQGFGSRITMYHNENELVKKIRNLAIQLNESLETKEDTVVASKVFDAYRNKNVETFNEAMLSEEVKNTPVFQEEFISSNEFYDIYMSLPNKLKSSITDTLHNFSSRFIYYGTGLTKELTFFKNLLSLVNQTIDAQGGKHQLSTANLFKLKYFLEPTVERFEKILNNEFYQ